jgi:hypothetical protein
MKSIFKKEIDCLVFSDQEDLRQYVMDFIEKRKLKKSDIINIETDFNTGKCYLWFWNFIDD